MQHLENYGKDLDSFISGYLECAFWLFQDNEDNPDKLDIDDLSADSLAHIKAECAAFYFRFESDISCEDGPTGNDGSDQYAMAGHDFFLTRNGHGAGFWDGDWPEPHATKLSEASRRCGEVTLYTDNDSQVHYDGQF